MNTFITTIKNMLSQAYHSLPSGRAGGGGLLLLLLLLTSCQQEEIELYNLDECKIYFQEVVTTSSNGSQTFRTYSYPFPYSFVGVSSANKYRLMQATVRLMGDVKDFDRPIRVVVDQERTTMGPDGYEFNADTLRIKAGDNKCIVRIKLMRTEAIRTKPDTLVLKLEPNEHFQLLEHYKSNSSYSASADTLDATRFRFAVSEVYTKPNKWDTVAANYFGKYSVEKYIFVNEFFGFNEEDWGKSGFETGVVVAGRMAYYARELQKELQRLADEGTPMKEANGDYMQLAEGYKVDYTHIGTKQ